MIFDTIQKKRFIGMHKARKHLLPDDIQGQMLGFLIKGKFCGGRSIMRYLAGVDNHGMDVHYSDEHVAGIKKYISGMYPTKIYQDKASVESHRDDYR